MHSVCHSVFPLLMCGVGVSVCVCVWRGGGGEGTVEEGAHERSCVLITAF